MQKRHVLVCEGSLCPRELPDVSGPGLGEAGRYRVVGRKASVMEKQYQKSRGVTSMNLSSRLRHQVYKILKHEAFILRNWGACVDTRFW